MGNHGCCDFCQIHWFSIINSLAIVLLLTGIVAMIMMRTLRRDFSRYNEEDKEDLQEESGWKLVHADVFRPPPAAILLCASLGTGMQLLAMSAISIFCAMLGFLSPANRGGLLTATILVFMLMGVPAGYFSSYTYKSLRGAFFSAFSLFFSLSFSVFFSVFLCVFLCFFSAFLSAFLSLSRSSPHVTRHASPTPHRHSFRTLRGTEWKTATILTALLYPGLVSAIFFVLNFFIWGQVAEHTPYPPPLSPPSLSPPTHPPL